MAIESVGTPALWIGFLVFVLGMLALDLGVFHRSAHVVRAKEAAIWSLVWVSLALVFNAGLWWMFGEQRALEFLTGYVIEKSLAVDNIFVFIVIFAYFKVPSAYQHRVLLWGILGALVMRALFIGLGAVLLAKFHWVIYIFGGILVLTAIKMLVQKEGDQDPGNNPAVKLFRRFVPMTEDYRGPDFWVIENGKWLATPLLLVLVVLEFTDLVFAVDSIPAIFAVTGDPFIVFTSNIFAILGLRAMFFLLAGVMGKFHYLKTGLAFVLGFVGFKMLLMDVYKIPILLSLGIIALILTTSVVASLLRPAKTEETLEHGAEGSSPIE